MANKTKNICICFLLSFSLLALIEITSDVQLNVKADTIHVGPGQTYTSIQEGIDAANPGDTVYVHASTYYENIIINKTINLTGENKETAVIDGMGGFIVAFFKGDYINLSGFTIRNAEFGIWAYPSNYTRIEDNIICNTSFGGGGIMIIGSYHTIKNNIIYNTTEGIIIDSISVNNILNNNLLYDNIRGIHILGDNNTIINNEIVNTSQYGIPITGCNNILINNNINDVGLGGLEFANIDTYNNTIMNNTINNAEYGIRIWLRANNISFHNCLVNNSRYTGIILDEGSQNSSFINCSIQNSNRYDVTISESNTTFLNTAFEKTKVRFWDNSSTLKIQWFMHVLVKDIGNNVISNATVEIYNISDNLVANGKTDNDGFFKWIVVTERIQNYSINITHTPHNVSASKDSYVGFALPEPIMDCSKQVNITLEIPQPLHHIDIIPLEPISYYIGDSQIYTAIGWNDADETQKNLTWVPKWSVDNTTIASIDSVTGDFTTLALGSSSVNVTDSDYQIIFNTSAFTIEPWPLHHIVITPFGPERYYVGDERSYSATGWNDAEETQQNNTWTPVWSVDNSSIATIISDTGEFTAIALGNSVVNVTAASTGIYNTSSFIVEPWPLHHIVITPLGPESYYVGDTQTYTVIGWNDAQEIQMNTTWTPLWEVDETTIATIDSDTGFFTATNIGNGNVICRSTAIPEISNTSSFSVLAWPFHHINIIPKGLHTYYIGDTQIFTAVGWNDAEETQMNDTWVPVWSVGNISVASINETGFFTAISLGSSVINVTCASQPWVYSVVAFTVNPWPLHHISILPAGPVTYYIGDIVIYTAIAWNDVEETQMNTTWTPVWTLGGEIQELTWEGEEARLEAKKSGEGSIKCSDDETNIYATSDIVIKDKDKDETPIWLWILLLIIVVVFLIILLLIYHNKKQGNTGKEESINNTYK